MDLTRGALLGGAALLAGGINAVAGGGTLVSFPAAIAAGLSPLVANATNAVALTPAALGAAWGYRRELRRDGRVLRALLLPSLLGGGTGAVLLLLTPQRVFDAVVPALVLLATLLLLWQNLRRPPAASATASAPAPVPASAPAPALTSAAAPAETAEWRLQQNAWLAALLQFLVSVYGGYFGAGMGIMMLALFSMLGRGVDIHRMNAVKAVLGGVINGIASIAFLAAKAVDAEATAIMMASAIAGGVAGAAIARRVNPAITRWAVVALGLVLTGTLTFRRLSRSL